MRGSSRYLALCVVLALAVSPALAAGNANFLLGPRALDGNEVDGRELEVFEDLISLGVSVDFGPGDWPISFVGGLSYTARQDHPDFSHRSKVWYFETSLGVRKVWTAEKSVHPFVGGGLARIEGELYARSYGSKFDRGDDDMGFYGEGGIYGRIGSAFNLGFAVRVLRGTRLEIEGEEMPSEYVQFGILAGWGWGN